jgi:serine protease Do
MKSIMFLSILSLPVGFFTTPLRAQKATTRTPAAAMALQRGASSFLGIGVAEIDSERAKSLNLKDEHGIEVKSVEAESPAAKAGIKEGDVVLEYDGQRVEGTEQFMRLVRETPAGRQAKLLISRNGANQTLIATIGKRPSGFFAYTGDADAFRDSFEGFQRELDTFNRQLPRGPEIRMPDMPQNLMSWRSQTLGIESESLGSQLAEYFGVKQGVLVRSVNKGSAAEKAGLKAGDVIVKVDDKKVAGPREMASILRESRSKKTVPVMIVRNRSEMTLHVTLDENSSNRDFFFGPGTIRFLPNEL